MLSLFYQTLRRLARERGFTITVLATLTLCIAANVTIYTIFDHVLLRPLPFSHAEQLVTLFNSYPRAGAPRSSASLPNYYDRRGQLKTLSSLSIFTPASAIVGDKDNLRRVETAKVSPDFFDTLSVSLARGRMFTEENMLSKADAVAVITDSFWRTEFNSDPNIVGRQFMNDGVPVTITGVLPPSFHYLSSEPRFFRPASHTADEVAAKNRHNNGYQMIARLSPSSSLPQAQAEVNTFTEQLLASDPSAEISRNAGYHVFVASLHADSVQSVRAVLVLLQVGALTLLLIGIVNLLNLLLIRAHSRQKEIAIRQALGAERRHVVVEALMETFLITSIGGMLGATLGVAILEFLQRFMARYIPLGNSIGFDSRIFCVAFLCTLIVTVLLAVPLATFTLKFRVARGLQSESRSGTANRSAQRVRYVFIVAQISLAHILVAEAGLLSLSLHKLAVASLGFQPDQVLTARLSLPRKNYQGAAKQVFMERLYSALKSIPGVSAVGMTSVLPLEADGSNDAYSAEGVPRSPGESVQTHFYKFAYGEYWSALGIPLIEGRFLDNDDNRREQRVCVVDSAFAQHYWPGQSALGRQISQGGQFNAEGAFTVVGVVGAVKQDDIRDPATRGTIYFTYRDLNTGGYSIALRSTLGTTSLALPLQQAVNAIDPGLPVEHIKSMRALIDGTLVTTQSPAFLASAFAGLAIILAFIGTYGVLAFAVNQRRREVGIRMALGARPDQVLRQFMKLGLSLILVGIVIGSIGSWITAQASRSLLFGIDLSDPSIFLLSAIVLSGVGFLAVFIPSRRATLVNPIEALQSE